MSNQAIQDELFLQGIPNLEQIIQNRIKTDTKLINWWLYVLFINPITIGLYGIYVYIKRIERRDQHFRRINDFFNVTLDCCKEIALKKNIDITPEANSIQRYLDTELFSPKHACLCLAFSILTFGLFSLFVCNFLLKNWAELQELESNIIKEFNIIFQKLNLIKYPIMISITAKKRSLLGYIFFSIFTLGLYAIYIDNVIHNEPNDVFDGSKNFEDNILQVLKQA